MISHYPVEGDKEYEIAMSTADRENLKTFAKNCSIFKLRHFVKALSNPGLLSSSLVIEETKSFILFQTEQQINIGKKIFEEELKRRDDLAINNNIEVEKEPSTCSSDVHPIKNISFTGRPPSTSSHTVKQVVESIVGVEIIGNGLKWGILNHNNVIVALFYTKEKADSYIKNDYSIKVVELMNPIK